MRTLIITFSILLLSQFSFCQDLGINHYQRKSDALAFAFPPAEFSAVGLLLNLPDSLYNFGDVRIKKAQFDSFTVNNYRLQFKSDTITSVEFVVSGKKHMQAYLVFLSAHSAKLCASQKEILTDKHLSFIELMDGLTVYTYQKIGRKAHIKITTSLDAL